MNVWMSTLRRGTLREPVSYHHIQPDGRRTVCGRYIGKPDLPPDKGYVMGRIEAMDLYAARECGQCGGSAVSPMPIGRDGKPASKHRGVSRWGR